MRLLPTLPRSNQVDNSIHTLVKSWQEQISRDSYMPYSVKKRRVNLQSFANASQCAPSAAAEGIVNETIKHNKRSFEQDQDQASAACEGAD
jgi:hypothetical protein